MSLKTSIQFNVSWNSFKRQLAPEIMNELFDLLECPYPLRIKLRFKSQNICTERYGTGMVAFIRYYLHSENRLPASYSFVFAHRYYYICFFTCLSVSFTVFFFAACFCFVLFFAPHPFSLLTLLRSSND